MELSLSLSYFALTYGLCACTGGVRKSIIVIIIIIVIGSPVINDRRCTLYAHV